jgi:hypothetical protein
MKRMVVIFMALICCAGSAGASLHWSPEHTLEVNNPTYIGPVITESSSGSYRQRATGVPATSQVIPTIAFSGPVLPPTVTPGPTPPSAVPEPATFALLGLGVLSLLILRRRIGRGAS